ncbi:MAG TPA: alginate export family protein [Verrucomicrobiae bacterium]|jgi:hypothetical protein|nr:alginate export family protein [Verrucomicrobiae bacterium]
MISLAVVGAAIGKTFPVSADESAFEAPPPFQQLRYDENYAYLQDGSRSPDYLDPLKFIPLNARGDFYLTLGGELRERYEAFHNYNWGKGPQTDDGYLLQRYMVHADLHLGPYARFFAQFKSGLENGRNGGPRPPDKDEADLNQAFVDVLVPLNGDDSAMLRLGRQELSFGSLRLVSPREGPNVRQSFDGARATLQWHHWKIDGFIARPAETAPGVFDDNPDPAKLFWGTYATHSLPVIPGGSVDFYYFGLERDSAAFNQGVAREERHTLGARIWGAKHGYDYNFETVYQFGSFGAGSICAWSAASDTGYTFGSLPFTPRLGLKADIVSGDSDPKSADLGTFNALFPKGAYFAETDLIGPANIIDFHPSLGLKLTKNVSLTTDWDFFWRQTTRDGIYGVADNPLRSGQQNTAAYIGSQVQTRIDWQFDRHLAFSAAYAHFFAGAYLKESPPGEDVNYFSAWATYKF